MNVFSHNTYLVSTTLPSPTLKSTQLTIPTLARPLQ